MKRCRSVGGDCRSAQYAWPSVGAKFSDGLRTGQIHNSRNSGSISPSNNPRIIQFGLKFKLLDVDYAPAKSLSRSLNRPLHTGLSRLPEHPGVIEHFRRTIESPRQERHICKSCSASLLEDQHWSCFWRSRNQLPLPQPSDANPVKLRRFRPRVNDLDHQGPSHEGTRTLDPRLRGC